MSRDITWSAPGRIRTRDPRLEGSRSIHLSYGGTAQKSTVAVVGGGAAIGVGVIRPAIGGCWPGGAGGPLV